MQTAIENLSAHNFSCPESAEISAHILAVLEAHQPTDEDAQAVVYAVSVPFFLETVWNGAKGYGQLEPLLPIFTYIRDYFLAEHDLVPDHMGAAGLLDDSYLVYCFVDRINKLAQDQHGEEIADLDTETEMQTMAAILGSEIAATLENHMDTRMGTAPPDVDLAVVGKYFVGGLAALFVINKLIKSGQPSNDDRWLNVANGYIYNGG